MGGLPSLNICDPPPPQHHPLGFIEAQGEKNIPKTHNGEASSYSVEGKGRGDKNTVYNIYSIYLQCYINALFVLKQVNLNTQAC
jgi:hypothetical protein